jgi:hypothetical protein
VTASAYSAEELWALGVPIKVADGSLGCECDIRSCFRRAEVIIPGAVLCVSCLDERTIRDDDGVGYFDVRLEDLVGGERLRSLRDDEYEERARRHRVEGRIAAWDERLGLVASDAVADLLEDLGLLD